LVFARHLRGTEISNRDLCYLRNYIASLDPRQEALDYGGSNNFVDWQIYLGLLASRRHDEENSQKLESASMHFCQLYSSPVFDGSTMEKIVPISRLVVFIDDLWLTRRLPIEPGLF